MSIDRIRCKGYGLMNMRIEKDLLGELQLPIDVLYGVHTARAIDNFPISKRAVRSELISAYGQVKLAALLTNFELGYINEEKFKAIKQACEEMIDGKLEEHIKVDALQGGAGTSTNMNVNEVLANRALEILGKELGRYDLIHPLGDINLHQSTNDTYSTALKISAIYLLDKLEDSLVLLLNRLQEKEKEFAHIVKVGRTQMQDAVLITLGREFSAYADAIGRDRWRVYKCKERLRVVNIGGTAIGTGLDAPKKYIFKVIENLKRVTGLGLSRADNLVDATQNADVFVEVSGILKACAANLFKIANDLRFLSSGPVAGIGEIRLPARQAGSSIMPGKVNPVIPEAVMQVAMLVNGNDVVISQSAGMGNLELNPFLPLIAELLLCNLQILQNASLILADKCIDGIKVNKLQCKSYLENSTSIVTALISRLGYEKAQEIVLLSEKEGKTIREIVLEKRFLDNNEYEQLITAENVTKLGF